MPPTRKLGIVLICIGASLIAIVIAEAVIVGYEKHVIKAVLELKTPFGDRFGLLQMASGAYVFISLGVVTLVRSLVKTKAVQDEINRH